MGWREGDGVEGGRERGREGARWGRGREEREGEGGREGGGSEMG